jgi:hypothetical protein
MFKKFLPIAALVISVQFNAFSQVGIGTTSPATTLDVKGVPTNSTIADGMIVPTLTGNELKAKDAVYGSSHNGTIVYVTAAVTSASAKTTNVNSPGYFYYDGSVWQRIVTGSSTDNIYSTDGTIGSGRTVNVTNTLNFDAGTLFLDGTNNRIGIGTATPTEKLDLVGNFKFTGSIMPQNNAGISGQFLRSYGSGQNANWGYLLYANARQGLCAAGGNPSTGDVYGIEQVSSAQSGTTPAFRLYSSGSVASHIAFGKYTNATAFTEWMRINTDGNVGIGTATPTEKLDLTGNVKFSGALMPNNTAGTAGQVLVSNGAGSAPNWVNVPNMTYGDIKTGIQSADHGGWVKLDGRAKSTLSSDQQTRATALGIGTNLPDATNSCLIQNGTALGSVSGSNNKTITQANLPNINLTAASVTAGTPSGTIGGGGAHFHSLGGSIVQRTGVSGGPTPGVFSDGGPGSLVFTNTEPNHTHTFTGIALPGHAHNVPLGGSGTALDITPKSLSVNTFIYLGN